MPHNLRNGYALKLPSANSTYSGINSVLFRACSLWNRIPLFIKQSQTILEFKSKMKTLRYLILHYIQDGVWKRKWWEWCSSKCEFMRTGEECHINVNVIYIYIYIYILIEYLVHKLLTIVIRFPVLLKNLF